VASRGLRRLCVLDQLAHALIQHHGTLADIAAELVADCRRLSERINALDSQIRRLVTVVGVQVNVHHFVRWNVHRFRCGDGVLAVSLLLSVRGGREAADGGLGSTSVAGVEAVSSAV
jgi:hypothetical protein